MTTPCSTYRLQLHKGFDLRQARELVPYLHTLGISHVYASPMLKAYPGSIHGYDVCDHSLLNPELGTETDLEALVSALRQHDMGLVLDIVPNHMGIGGRENAWWWDVLKHGRASRFAEYFDIEWEVPDPRLHGKVLVPILGDSYGRVLQRGELRLVAEQGETLLAYFEHRFPLDPATLTAPVAPDTAAARRLNADPTLLDALIQQQHYLLVEWRRADTELNYRRFFNIRTLAGIRVEDPRVFDAVHALALRWHARGWVGGFRVDHPDGLRDPTGYFERLRVSAAGAWIVAEKILQPGERINEDWPIAGTTGYEFMWRSTGLFVDPGGEKTLADLYVKFTGEPSDYGVLVRERRRQALRELLLAEVDRLTRLLVRIVNNHWRYRDLAQEAVREALIEVAARLPVYRTYVQARPGRVLEADATVISETIARAREERTDLPSESFDVLEDLLLLRLKGEHEADFVMRFQQLTGPAMAKGAEDTAFYCYNRFIALNMVGGDPSHFGMSTEAFHEECRQAQRRWPHAMLATSTHDTKRSEDVRMRLCLLSEIPADWRTAVLRWSATNEKHRRFDWPDRNFEYFFYQTLVGAWPLPPERAVPVMEKAAREAKQHTSWSRPNPDYEAAVRDFVLGTLGDSQFITDLVSFVSRLIVPGQVNSLAETLLKLTTPGVPDMYQGTELWDLSLVDPDNRRPVDFDLRRRLATEVAGLSAVEAWGRRRDGLPKLFLIYRALKVRRAHPAWFGANSTYEPLWARGPKAEHVVAFVRGGGCITVAPRLILGLKDDWGETELALPAGTWHNALTDEGLAPGRCRLADLLREFPVALLIRKEGREASV
ncbi:MAG TPA: malto-oligosyltrehalose synthase [Verrucomicrobiae bacterium]